MTTGMRAHGRTTRRATRVERTACRAHALPTPRNAAGALALPVAFLLSDSASDVPPDGRSSRDVPASGDRPAPAPHPSVARQRVVVADDDAVLRVLVRKLCERDPGLELVGEGTDGREAIAVVAEQEPDVVLLDLDMPNVDGWRAIADIRAAAPDAMVIALSALQTDEDAMAAFDHGAFAFVDKVRLRLGFGADVAALAELFARWRAGEDVWADPKHARIWR